MAWFRASLLAALLVTLVAAVYGQEYLTLSIDCGSEVNYTDPETGIHWVTDAGYISTGNNFGNITVIRHKKDLPILEPKKDRPLINGKQAENLRYFDGLRSRYCYVLPTKPRVTYLIRTTFYLGNWTSPPDIEFDVYINATYWSDINYFDVNSEPFVTYTPEGIVYSPGSELYVCLVTLRGKPFISALELRELAPGMYSNVVGSFQFINNMWRENSGAPPGTNTTTSSVIRYPDDPFDRCWTSPSRYVLYPSISSNLSSSSIDTQEKPPLKVMEDSGIRYNSEEYISFAQNSSRPVGAITTYGYFQELDGNASATNVRGIDYYVNDVFVRSFNVSNAALEIPTVVLQVPDFFWNLTFRRASWSRLPPLINAFEIYASSPMIIAPTAIEDLNAIAGIQQAFNLTDWTGDPCTPVRFDWLSCTAEVTFRSTQYEILTNRITDLSLSGRARISTLPQGVAKLAQLSTLNVSNTGLNRLLALNNLTVLDFSNNVIGGNVGDLIKNIDLQRMEKIFAANNSFQGPFPSELLDTRIQNLRIVDFDDNPNINGTLNLTGWYEYLLSAASTSTKSFSRVTSLKNDGVDDIIPSEGVLTRAMESFLDLSNTTSLDNAILLGGNPWCNGKTSTQDSLARRFLCRSNVDETYKRAVESSGGRNTATIIGSTVGACLLVVCLLSFAFFWKLKRKSSALRTIQEGEKNGRLHLFLFLCKFPRKFLLCHNKKCSHHSTPTVTLRVATKNFATENHLGQGGYGVVYKGKLADGTMVAVKRLHQTSAKKALSEFLNEVVLITGIKHRNLVQLKGCCIKDDQRLLVYEYAEHGNLAEALWGSTTTGSKLNWHQRHKVCIGIARGLSYLHEELQQRIIHRDIKPANVLLDSALNAKIADFGLARPLLDNESQAEYSNIAGTFGYFAPEYFIEGHLTEKADVFSCGVVMLEIVSGRKCIDRKLPADRVSLLKWVGLLCQEGRVLDILDPSIHGTSNEDEVKRVIDVACSCLNNDPSERPTMSHVAIMLQGGVDIALSRDSNSAIFLGHSGQDFVYSPQGFVYSPHKMEPSSSSSLGTLQEETCLLDAREASYSTGDASQSSDQATMEISEQVGR